MNICQASKKVTMVWRPSTRPQGHSVNVRPRQMLRSVNMYQILNRRTSIRSSNYLARKPAVPVKIRYKRYSETT